MKRYAFVIQRVETVKNADGSEKGAETIVWPKEGVLYYDDMTRRTSMAIIVPLLADLADVGIGAKNIDEARGRVPFRPDVGGPKTSDPRADDYSGDVLNTDRAFVVSVPEPGAALLACNKCGQLYDGMVWHQGPCIHADCDGMVCNVSVLLGEYCPDLKPGDRVQLVSGEMPMHPRRFAYDNARVCSARGHVLLVANWERDTVVDGDGDCLLKCETCGPGDTRYWPAHLCAKVEDEKPKPDAHAGLVPIRLGGPWCNGGAWWERWRDGRCRGRSSRRYRWSGDALQYRSADGGQWSDCCVPGETQIAGLVIHAPDGWPKPGDKVPEGCYILDPPEQKTPAKPLCKDCVHRELPTRLEPCDSCFDQGKPAFKPREPA